jgi:hypothetical protein
MPRDLPPYRFELRYPSDGLDDVDEYGPEEFRAPPGSYKVLRAQTTEEARREAALLWEARHPVDAIGYAVWRGDWGCVDSYRISNAASSN